VLTFPALDDNVVVSAARLRDEQPRLLEREETRDQLCLSRLSVGIFSATALFLLLLVSSVILTVFWQVSKGRLTWSNKSLYLER
jgi:hypothetical protein